MSDGYTPVFGTVFNGTLCGKWPDLAVWLTLLPLADWRGHVDMTPEAIASRTGWPLDLLLQGIEGLCLPDPRSRSKDEEGRRLVPIDSERPWGWRVVNIQKYRRLASGRDQSSVQVADGRNAEKVRRYKERHQQTPQTPPGTSTHQNSDSYADSDSNKEKMEKRAARAATAQRLPEDFELTEQRQAIARAEAVNPEREFARFCDHWRAASGANARKHDWDAAWRNWCRKAADIVPNGRAPETPKLTWRPGPED